MVDTAALVTLLAPYLPSLIKGSETVAEGGLREAGKDTWQIAKAIWEKLWPKIESKEAAKEAVEDFAKEGHFSYQLSVISTSSCLRSMT